MSAVDIAQTNGGSRAALSGSITITALPRTVNLRLYAGDDFAIDLTITDADGDPADLEGTEPAAEVRATADAQTVAAVFVVAVEGNVVRLRLPSAVTAELPWRGVWDCRLFGGRVITLVSGTVSVTPAVTRV